MKRAQLAERKVEKLKRLLLLTDPVVSGVVVGPVQIVQWNEYIQGVPGGCVMTTLRLSLLGATVWVTLTLAAVWVMVFWLS